MPLSSIISPDSILVSMPLRAEVPTAGSVSTGAGHYALSFRATNPGAEGRVRFEGRAQLLATPPASRPAATAEAALVQRLLARDERALGVLHERYAKNLLTVIRRVVHDEALAQDVLQESLLKLWLGIAGYDATRGRLFTWMVRVCCNQAIDALRSARHRFHAGAQSLEVAEVRCAPAPASFDPEHIGLRELTAQLKPRQREVIDLLYFGGCTQAEAAEQLAIPVPTVKTRARAALVALTRLAR